MRLGAPASPRSRRAWQRGAHDAYLVDYRLGAHTGLDVAHAILMRLPHAPVIMLTGIDDRAVDVRAGELGIADYLVKGQLDPRTLERSLRYASSTSARCRRWPTPRSATRSRWRAPTTACGTGTCARTSIYLSPRYKTMLGYAGIDELGDRRRTGSSASIPRTGRSSRQAVADHLAGRTEHFEAEYRMRGDRRQLPLDAVARAQAVRGADGRALRLAGSQTDVSDRKAAELQLQHDALHDSLTGLPNRVLFQDRLEHLVRRGIRNGGTSAVLFLDLDRFKIVNDSLGHLVGDGLLVEVAERLRRRAAPGRHRRAPRRRRVHRAARGPDRRRARRRRSPTACSSSLQGAVRRSASRTST